ncbi:hypothetical protein KIW84_020920 [Lathyrus oleraceus]|uniref:Uncharacterized protein n=1 Tax=Pisum sativum TaxID=3888 RepID=A0A9D4Y8P9_PEA|nr:hypothetical protein KIW84_020920 [Pisum sativum]
MDSKNVFLILGLLAMVLVISSEVSARELAETSTNAKEEVVEKSNEVNDAKYYGGGYGHGGGGGYGHGGGGGYGHGGGGGGYSHGGGYGHGGGGYGHGGGGGVSNNGN